jgi:hypothetical protein
MGSTENHLDKPSSANKEDDDACLYAIHLSTSFTFHMVFKAAIELKLFDIIASRGSRPDAYMSPSEIASQLPTKNSDAPYLLDRMLRLLTSYSLLTCSVRTGEDGRVQRLYGIAPAGKFYVQNEDGYSLGAVPLFSLHPPLAEVWYVDLFMQTYNSIYLFSFPYFLIRVLFKNIDIYISHFHFIPIIKYEGGYCINVNWSLNYFVFFFFLIRGITY